MDANDYSNKEREFLHEVGNLLSVIQGMSSFALRKIEAGPDSEELEVVADRLKRSLNATEKLIAITQERREFVKASQP